MKSGDKRPTELNPAPGCLLLLILGVFSVPCALLALVYLWFRDKRLLRHLKTRGRVLPWAEVEKHLHAGVGTLVVEQANKVGIRFWWTPDDLIVMTPVPIPKNEDLGMDYHRGKSSDPFVLWCFQNYLSATDGKAFLTSPKGLDLSGFIEKA